MEKKTDRRIRKTKHALREGLTKLMQEKSMKDISVKELTDLVDLNRGTFYLHYNDIFDMIDQIEEELLSEFSEIITSCLPVDMDKNPSPMLFEQIFMFLKENSAICAVLLSRNGDIAFMDKLKSVVRGKCLNIWLLMIQKEENNQFEYFYSFILNGCIGLFQSWLENGLKETPAQMGALANEFMLHGMLCPFITGNDIQ